MIRECWLDTSRIVPCALGKQREQSTHPEQMFCGGATSRRHKKQTSQLSCTQQSQAVTITCWSGHLYRIKDSQALTVSSKDCSTGIPELKRLTLETGFREKPVSFQQLTNPPGTQDTWDMRVQ